MSSERSAPCGECDVTMDLQEPASGAVVDLYGSPCSPHLGDKFEALLRSNAEVDGFYTHEASTTGSSDGSLTLNHHSTSPSTLECPVQSTCPSNASRPWHWPKCTSEQSVAEKSGLPAVGDPKFGLYDFYSTPGLEWDPELLQVPADEADKVAAHGLSACETGPQCFNCGSPLEWDEATELLEDCDMCCCPN
ncbi:hypothetical protein PG993_008688 [Apiospora rasikravindrae]|uniref:Uncharacterized protein n=1 Tax=Apiospora rasikravindrae TaxID=990691 RepID=A0ABR1SP16_9PEZI